MSRIDLNDTPINLMVKMAEGNPGAATAMVDIMIQHDSIDPQAIMGGMGAIRLFDTWEIYGTEIYVLYNDKCGRDVRTLLVLLRAVQLGFMSQGKLKLLAEDQMREVNLTKEDWEDIDTKVCSRIPMFKPKAAEESK